MKLRINKKIIQDRCGVVSYKRGDLFFRTKKVLIEKYYPSRCEATVSGTEEFFVIVEVDENKHLHTKCSCPALASFQRDCQHIAAVLIAISEYQRNGTVPGTVNEKHTVPPDPLTAELLNIFDDHSKRSSGYQLHFENRQVLDAEFLCMPIAIEKEHLLGIKMYIGSNKVQKIRDFLFQVKRNSSYSLANLKYDPTIHCFPKEADNVIHQLIQVMQDEKIYIKELTGQWINSLSEEMILIPPSSWAQLLSLLKKAPLVKLEHNGRLFDGLHSSKEKLPLQFELGNNKNNGFHLKVNGLNQMIVLNSYQSVLVNGRLIQLKSEDSKRLTELKQLLNGSDVNQLSISNEQINVFLEKVLPGLKKLGEVHINGSVVDQFRKIPLKAKLYLDRVRNRLLAGLEFHYENIVINPLEDKEILAGSMIIRDVEKEDKILELMDSSSFTKTDEGYFLHNEELEYEFLYHVLPKLQKLVQIYATTAVRNRISKGTNRPLIRVKLKKERTNWLEFTFEMDGIPEKQIRELLQALEEKRKYYRLRNGSLLSLETREFEEIQRFLNALPVQNEDWESRLEVPIVRALPFLDSVDESNMFKVEKSFRTFLENIQNPGSLEIEIPIQLEAILRDYQKQGFRWMKTLASYGFGGILADDMGLGKTLQSIAFILSVLPTIRKKKLPILIICPSSLTYNWLSELMKFAPDVQAVVVDGNQTERYHIQNEAMNMDVLITSYPLLRRDIKWFEKQSFHTAFFDEAQAFKNPITQTARAVKKIRAKHRFALTGTPIENSLEELWSIFHVVFPELFLGLKEYSNLTRKTISRRIRPFMLRRLKEDVLSELPGKIESTDSVDLLPDQKKLYTAYLAKLRHDTLKHLDKDTLRKNRIKILAGLTRLRQICCHPALFVDGYKGSSSKFQQLLEIVEEAKISGRRVLIFSQFTKMLDLIGRELVKRGLPYFYLDGQTPSDERVEICHRFNRGERDLFLISLKAGGTGLNLTGADTVVLYDNWWNPAVESQAADRVYRIGQKNEVQVIKLVARGTIEEKMNELQEKKKNLIEEIMGKAEKMSPTLTEEDIREILNI